MICPIGIGYTPPSLRYHIKSAFKFDENGDIRSRNALSDATADAPGPFELVIAKAPIFRSVKLN
jgi:hypothetical protein